jgi:hypothetical protein
MQVASPVTFTLGKAKNENCMCSVSPGRIFPLMGRMSNSWLGGSLLLDALRLDPVVEAAAKKQLGPQQVFSQIGLCKPARRKIVCNWDM